jgi:oligopeptide transport system permease protein
MTKYIIRRLLVSIPVLFAITLATFLLIQALPGGPFSVTGMKQMPDHMRIVMERRYGLDKPLYIQFLRYLGNLFQGDLGPLFRTPGRTVNDIVAESMPVSFQLGILAILVGFGFGIPAGIVAALYHNTPIDYSATFMAVLFRSIPNIVLAPLMILVLGVYLDWLPIAFWGSEPPYILGFLPEPNLNFWSHAVMPTLALGLGMSAGIARLTRAGLLEVLNQDYVRTARAKGLRERLVIVRHALKNSMIPVATVLGPLLAAVLTGTFTIEQIFALNGLGRQFIGSVQSREYFVLTSITLIYGIFLVLGNLLVDMMYAWLDPRIRYD